MAAGTLLTVLANIPWGQVVDNAPKVADAAARLWSSVNNRKRQAADEAEAAPPAAASEAERLQARMETLENGMRALQEELQASSELIKALAEQNTQLIERVELNRRRLVRLAMAGSVVGAVLLGAVLYLLLAVR